MSARLHSGGGVPGQPGVRGAAAGGRLVPLPLARVRSRGAGPTHERARAARATHGLARQARGRAHRRHASFAARTFIFSHVKRDAKGNTRLERDRLGEKESQISSARFAARREKTLLEKKSGEKEHQSVFSHSLVRKRT